MRTTRRRFCDFATCGRSTQNDKREEFCMSLLTHRRRTESHYHHGVILRGKPSRNQLLHVIALGESSQNLTTTVSFHPASQSLPCVLRPCAEWQRERSRLRK